MNSEAANRVAVRVLHTDAKRMIAETVCRVLGLRSKPKLNAEDKSFSPGLLRKMDTDRRGPTTVVDAPGNVPDASRSAALEGVLAKNAEC